MDEIIVKVPASHKALAAALSAVVNRVVAFETQGRSLGPVDYRAHEVALAEDCGRIERESHAISLASLDVNRARIRIDGVLHYRVGRYGGEYKCRTGELEVMRSLYRKSGGRKREDEYAAAVNTVSLRSGAVEDEWLPETASAMAHRVARGTSRAAAEASPVEHTLPYSRSSFERVGHAVGAAMRSKRVDIEEALIAELEIPADARSVSVAMDRTTLRMGEPKKRPVGRPRKGAPKRSEAVAWRMAWTATVTLHDEDGEALHTIRYGRMPYEDGESLAETIASDALVLKQRRPDLHVVTLGDGGGDVQRLLERHVDEQTFGCRVYRLIDFWHVIEKLAAAAAVIASSVACKDVLVAEWRRRLCVRRSAPSTILTELRASGCENVAVGKEKPVHEAITYFENRLLARIRGRLPLADAATTWVSGPIRSARARRFPQRTLAALVCGALRVETGARRVARGGTPARSRIASGVTGAAPSACRSRARCRPTDTAPERRTFDPQIPSGSPRIRLP